MVGLGSNLLVRDNGFDGVTIHTKNLKELNLLITLLSLVLEPLLQSYQGLL